VGEELRELFRYRELIGILVRRELRLRYKNSVLGFFWSLLPLILQVLVLSVVVKFIYGVGPRALSAYILCAYIPWNFFQNGLLDSSSSVLAQYGLLKKVYFPREILPIATVLGNGIHLLLALGVFFVYRYGLTTLLFGWPGPPPREILWLPVLMLINLLLVLGLSFFLSALNVFHEDIKFIAQSVLNLAFFALPIAWFTEQVFYSTHIPVALRHPLIVLYNANPISWLISAYRQVLLGPTVLGYRGPVAIMTAPFDYRYFGLATLTSVLIALGGYAYFNRRKWQFVERP
jgi:lipopolysaccharide transport system permease protein